MLQVNLDIQLCNLKFNSGSIYACFEEAVSEYSQQINHYNTKNWMWEHYGSTIQMFWY